jgi:hypothetical protein
MHLIYRLKYEDHDFEPIDDYDVFEDRPSALTAFGHVCCEPDNDLGSVYVTADDGCDERLIASAYLCDD